MPVERVDDPDDPRLALYRGVRDPFLLRRGESFVAEGREVVRTLLTRSPFATRSVLVTETGLAALRDAIEERLETLPVLVVSPGVIERVTGFNIHRGCLAIGARRAPLPLDALMSERPDARTLVVLEQVGNADNVGAVFRNAAAFAADAVILGPGCCDPLYRKAIRVSMGASLRLPFASGGPLTVALGGLRRRGFTVVGLTPAPGAETIDRFADRCRKGTRLALVLGAEGSGLSAESLAAADARVRIPLAAGFDSLNVAVAAAVALHRLAPPLEGGAVPSGHVVLPRQGGPPSC